MTITASGHTGLFSAGSIIAKEIQRDRMVVQGEDGVVAFTRYHKFQCHEIGSNYPAARCLQGFIYGNMNNERHLEGTQFL